ncbi:hypothetical protein ACHAAC_08060 [Aeromicrobium sp. CF4.19]|uniref:hypothetical protein n=1 Tax=Aeromicrobium sp. CF4.19 TaxID=3373082 RepID=UPI003EE6ACCB
MVKWRTITGAVGGMALIVGALTLAPGMADEHDDTDMPAQAEAGGIEIWGSDPAGYPAEDGPWAGFGSHLGAQDVQLAIRADGTLEALPGTPAAIADIPAAVSSTTVIDAGVSQVAMAWAVTTDGHLHKWAGGSRGLFPDGVLTPADLGGNAVQAVGASNGSNLLVLLDSGEVTRIDSIGPTPIESEDGTPLTGVTQLGGTAGSSTNFYDYALLDDGSVAFVNFATWATVVPADAADPVVDIATQQRVSSGRYGTALTQSGRVLTLRADSSEEDAGFPADEVDGEVLQIARSGEYAAALTTTGDVVTWRVSSTGIVPENLQPPVALDGMDVLRLTGGNDTFGAIVVESDDPPGLEEDERSTIEGTPQVGETLTGTPATFTGDPDSTTYEWRHEGETEVLGTETTYTPVAGDVGEAIVFVTIASKEGQDDVESISDPTEPVEAAPVIDGQPGYAGDPRPYIGESLTVITAPTPGCRPTTTLQWFVGEGDDFAPIEGATSGALPLTEDYEGQFVKVVQTSTCAGVTESAESDPLGPVREAPVELAVVDQPTIEGDGQVGEDLTATPATFTDDEGVTLEHQWYADDELIEGETGTTLTVGVEQEGATITYATSATRAIDGAEATSDRSNEIGPVVPIDLTIIGQPTITGQPFIGETLTATPADVSDDRAEITFQWVAGDGEDFTPIEGATEETLELTEELRDQEVRVVQTASRSLDETSDSAESIAVGPITDAPEDLEIDTDAELTGTPRVGETLTGTPATFSPTEDVTVTNFWVIGDEEVEADGTELVLTDDHVGQNIQFKSVATRGDESLPSTSNTVGPVLVVLAATDAPTIEGTPQVGETLTGTPATFNDDEGVEIANRWLAGGEPISGETGSSLELTADQVGQEITFESIATRGDDTASDVSAPVGPVELAPLTADERPTISGDSQVGETLTGTPAEFSATEDVEVTNRWLADGEPIEGADGTELELTADLVGKEITFESTAVRGDEEPVVSESDPTDAVTPAGPGGSDDAEGGISAPDTFSPGDTITVTMSEDYAGQEVSVWLFSDPRELGTYTVTEDGTIRVEIPEDVELGEHQLTVYDESGDIIGWQAVTIVAPGGIGGIGGPGDAPGLGLGGALPNAGAPASLWLMIPLGLMFLLAGMVSMRMGRREST